MSATTHDPVMEQIIRTAWCVRQRDVDQRSYLVPQEYSDSTRISELLSKPRSQGNDQELVQILESRRGQPMRLGFGFAAHHMYFAYVARMQDTCESVHDFVVQYLSGKTFETNQLKERLEELKNEQSKK